MQQQMVLLSEFVRRRTLILAAGACILITALAMNTSESCPNGCSVSKGHGGQSLLQAALHKKVFQEEVAEAVHELENEDESDLEQSAQSGWAEVVKCDYGANVSWRTLTDVPGEVSSPQGRTIGGPYHYEDIEECYNYCIETAGCASITICEQAKTCELKETRIFTNQQHKFIGGLCQTHYQCMPQWPTPPPPAPIIECPAHPPRLSSPGGAQWTMEEALIVKAKIKHLFAHGRYGAERIHENYTCIPDVGYLPPGEAARNPQADEKCDPSWFQSAGFSPAKMLRLGFHDCLRYDDCTHGCDGCLNFKGMFIMHIGERAWKEFPEFGDNNNLAYTADFLELIYTEPQFPPYAPWLEVSMKDSGKSRADLWQMATMVAIEEGFNYNDELCRYKSTARSGISFPTENLLSGSLLKAMGLPCEIGKPKMKFKTGRKDCSGADVGPQRPFESLKHEIHPNPHWNGDKLVEFMQKTFSHDFNGRDTVAIMGAHSLGKLGPSSSFSYTWTRTQARSLNHEYYLNMVEHPKFMLSGRTEDIVPSGWKQYWLSGVGGQPGGAYWRPSYGGLRKHSAPFFWTHIFEVGPECYREGTGAWKNRGLKIKGSHGNRFQTDYCCQKLYGDQERDLDCLTWTANDEMMLHVDLGLYRKFDTTFYGRQTGCPGFTQTNWEDEDNWRFGGRGRGSTHMRRDHGCPLQDLDAGDGTPLYKIVEEYAEDQAKWVQDFIWSIEKMSMNGYNLGDLHDGPDVFNEHIHCEETRYHRPEDGEYIRGWRCLPPSTSDAPTRAPTTAPTEEYVRYERMVCGSSTSVDLIGTAIDGATYESCKARCDENSECTGFQLGRVGEAKEGKCWIKKDISFAGCLSNDRWDMFVKAGSLSYELITSGHCHAPIVESSECANAATELLLADTTVSDDSNTVAYDPPYCYFEDGSLKFNGNGQNTGQCTSADKCLCKVVPTPAPPPTPVPPPTPPPPPTPEPPEPTMAPTAPCQQTNMVHNSCGNVLTGMRAHDCPTDVIDCTITSPYACKVLCDAHATCNSFAMRPLYGCQLCTSDGTSVKSSGTEIDTEVYSQACAATLTAPAPAPPPEACQQTNMVHTSCGNVLTGMSAHNCPTNVIDCTITTPYACKLLCDAHADCNSFALRPMYGCQLCSSDGTSVKSSGTEIGTAVYSQACAATLTAPATPNPTPVPTTSQPTTQPTFATPSPPLEAGDFDRYDAHHDGSIDREEFESIASREDWHLFEEMDVDGDGRVTPEEYNAHFDAQADCGRVGYVHTTCGNVLTGQSEKGCVSNAIDCTITTPYHCKVACMAQPLCRSFAMREGYGCQLCRTDGTAVTENSNGKVYSTACAATLTAPLSSYTDDADSYNDEYTESPTDAPTPAPTPKPTPTPPAACAQLGQVHTSCQNVLVGAQQKGCSIDVIDCTVHDAYQCKLLCDAHSDCNSFAIRTPYGCQLCATDGTSVKANVDSIVYDKSCAETLTAPLWQQIHHDNCKCGHHVIHGLTQAECQQEAFDKGLQHYAYAAITQDGIQPACDSHTVNCDNPICGTDWTWKIFSHEASGVAAALVSGDASKASTASTMAKNALPDLVKGERCESFCLDDSESEISWDEKCFWGTDDESGWEEPCSGCPACFEKKRLAPPPPDLPCHPSCQWNNGDWDQLCLKEFCADCDECIERAAQALEER